MPNHTDALDRLRDRDPARTMSTLSNNERDAIRERIVSSPTEGPLSRGARKQWRSWVRHGRTLIAFAAVLIGGGVATAAILGQGTTTTVAAGLSCISGTNGNNAKTDAYDVPQNGDSPTAACAPVIGVPASTLIACAKTVEGVVVFEADKDPTDQCRSLGLSPLPVDYNEAVTRIHALEQALTADYDQTDCISPKQLAQDADADLLRLGFAGWHAVINTASATHAAYAGPCGEFPARGSSISTADAALDAGNQTVVIYIGASRSILQLSQTVIEPLVDASGNQCYTLTGAQQLVRKMLDKAAGRTVAVEFAVTKELPYTTLMGGGRNGAYADGRQRYYDKGCTWFAPRRVVDRYWVSCSRT